MFPSMPSFRKIGNSCVHFAILRIKPRICYLMWAVMTKILIDSIKVRLNPSDYQILTPTQAYYLFLCFM